MRKAAIERHRQARAGHVLAVMPIHYPKEILTAMNILAVELWGPPGQARGFEAGRIQTYVCPLVRNALAYLVQGGVGELVDGVLYPNTCDSIQGLATLLPDFGRWEKGSFRFSFPMGEERPSSRRFLLAELRHLASSLAELTGQKLEPQRLNFAIDLHQRIDKARRTLWERRAYLDMEERAFYELLRRGEYCWPEEHLEELESALEGLSNHVVRERVPLMVSGLLPEPMSILEIVDQAGGMIVADDYAALGRRIATSNLETKGDPFETLARRINLTPPCPTRSIKLEERLRYLLRRYRESGARGLIVHEMKFCEPQLFDWPSIKRRFGEMKIPVLYLEGELESELSGQHVTRLEAFVETLQGCES